MSEVLDYQNEQKGIPTFLKVLCILTFIGAGYGLLTSVYGTFTIQDQIQKLENSQSLLSDSNSPFGSMNMDGHIETIKKYGLISNLINLFANGLCLFGALLMWKLKKMGYFIYIGGHVVALVSSFLMMGSGNSGGLIGSMIILVIIINIIFVLAFIIMYGVNFKHLKN
jgi:hypothetical protein